MCRCIERIFQLKEGVVFDIKRMSIDDGPGFRTVIFMKGCPLNCIWCHSPESNKKDPELVFYDTKCIRCKRCFKICPKNALQITENGQIKIDREKCVVCGRCAQICYVGALEIKGKRTSVQEVYQEIIKDRIFYETSGGGVTFSGGEPTMQDKFLLSTLKKCKNNGINTALDTCGYASKDVFEKITPYIDTFLYDLKHMDDKMHKKFTGKSNKRIIDNLKMLAEAGKNIIISVPVIPGYNTSKKNILETMALMKKLNLKELRVLNFNKMAGSKYSWLGKEFPLNNLEPMNEEWLSAIHSLGAKQGLIVDIPGKKRGKLVPY